MKVKALSRLYMSQFEYYEPYIVFSICEPGEKTPPLKIDPNRKHVHCVYIHDIDDVELAKRKNYKILDREQAREILEVVEKYKDTVNTIIVHCHAGVCRSAGLASALLYIYNDGDDREILNSPRYIPNKHVRNLVINTAIEMGIFDTDEYMRKRELTKNTNGAT